jgi:raffinose synthase
MSMPNKKQSSPQVSIVRISASSKTPGWIPVAIKGDRRRVFLERVTAHWLAPKFTATEQETLTLGGRACLLLEEASASKPARLLLPLPGPSHQAHLVRKDADFGILWKASPEVEPGTPVLAIAEGPDASVLIHEAVRAIEPLLRTFRPREKKAVPAWFDYFGWCTWDAFYQEVSAAKVIKGLRSFVAGGVGPRWMILDDGWQDTDGWLLNSTGTNSKFPGGLAKLRKSAKDLGVEYFGVWHALFGYWHGISPKGPLGKHHTIMPVKQNTDDFKGWPVAHNPTVRHTLSPKDWNAFYDTFYRELAKAGVDFTKVDGQSNTDYHAGEAIPAAELHNTAQAALQAACAVHLPDGPIHCMAHSPDILIRLAAANVWRNSDDFYPPKPFGAQAKHLIDNSWNALLFSEFAWPDWDMFHSKHEHAWFHAVARALSGGPVFVSDKPGHHDFELLRKIVLPDGRVPRFPQPGKPPARFLFDNPATSGKPLVLANHSAAGVAVAGFFNCATEGKVATRWSPSDLAGLTESRTVVVHDPDTLATIETYSSARHAIELSKPGSVAVRIISPLVNGLAAPLGLCGMPAGAAIVTEAAPAGDSTVRLRHSLAGNLAVWCRRKPARVTLSGKAVSTKWNASTGIMTLSTSSPGDCLLEFTSS